MYIGQVMTYFLMKGEVYILLCSNNRYYIGSSQDLERRLEEHSSGRVTSTMNLLPVKLVFSQTYETIQQARRVEHKLKRLKNRSIIETIISDGIIRMKI